MVQFRVFHETDQDVEGSSMAQSTPGKHVDERESSRVVGVREEGHFLSQAVTGFEVGLAILGGEASLGEGVAVEGKEDKATQRQGSNGATCRNGRRMANCRVAIS